MASFTPSGWIPVALSSDLPAGVVMPARTRLGEVALWRSQAGSVSAATDRCPHRGMRLSHGFVRGGAINCIYHGWRFGQDGQCLRIPAHPDLKPPKAIRTQNRIAVEQDGLIWLADEEQDTQPPSNDGFLPLRSITVEASIPVLKDVAQVSGAEHTMLTCSLGGETVKLRLVEQEDKKTLLHILVPANADTAAKIAISRAAETFRRYAETQETSGEAA